MYLSLGEGIGMRYFKIYNYTLFYKPTNQWVLFFACLTKILLNIYLKRTFKPWPLPLVYSFVQFKKVIYEKDRSLFNDYQSFYI